MVNLAALKDKVDAVVVCVPPQQVGQVLQDVAQNDLVKVWLQQESQTPQMIEQAHDLGLYLITGKCILM